MNSCCFNNKNPFTACIDKWTKNHKMVSLRFFYQLVSKHIKTNKLRNLGCLFHGFWSGPPIYLYY